MNDFEDQKDLKPLDTVTSTENSGENSPVISTENSTDSTIQPDSKIQTIPPNSEPQPKPKRTLVDNLLRGFAYILIGVGILVLLMFGACFIMIAGSSFH